MSRVERSVHIGAAPDAVWSTVADLDAVAIWNPNISSASCGGVEKGIGATRTCELAPRGRIEEVVTEWREGEQLWFAIGSHGAIRSADMGVVLTPAPGGTTVTAVADYHLSFGPLGPVIDRLTVKRLMARMLDAAMTGLKEHIETNEMKGTTADE